MAVAAFAGQVELEAAVFPGVLIIAGKGHALFDQPVDGFAAVLDGEAHRILAAQTTAGIEGVFDVGFDRVGIVQYGGDTALGPVGGAVVQCAFAQHGNAQVRRQGERQGQACGATADHQNVVLKMLAHVRYPQKKRWLVYRWGRVRSSTAQPGCAGGELFPVLRFYRRAQTTACGCTAVL